MFCGLLVIFLLLIFWDRCRLLFRKSRRYYLILVVRWGHMIPCILTPDVLVWCQKSVVHEELAMNKINLIIVASD